MARSSTTLKKGQTANPNGRPKKGESLTETMRMFLEDVPEGQELSYKEMFVKKSYQKAYEGDPTFAKLVWNYIDGMPISRAPVDEKGKTVIPIIPIFGNVFSDNSNAQTNKTNKKN